MNRAQLFSRSTDTTAPADAMLQSPVRTARRRITLLALGAILALVGVVSAGYYFAMRPATLRIAVGPQAGDDFKLIQAISQAFAREHKTVRLKLIPTESALASAASLRAGDTDLAVIRGDLPLPKTAQSVAVLHKNVAVLWVPGKAGSSTKSDKSKSEKSGLTAITDLSGRIVGVVGSTEANAGLLRTILQQYGVDPAKVATVPVAAASVADAIKTHKVDAFLAAGPLNSKVIAEALAATAHAAAEPVFLGVDASEALAANHPTYEAVTIPAGAFGGAPARPDNDVKTVSFSHYIAAREGAASDSTIGTLTQQLFAARQAVMAEVPLAAKIETPDTDKDAVIPVQPGAAAYVDGDQKTFMDRYSDYIWFALMGLSALGSVGAWVASYLRNDERPAVAWPRDRLLDMLAAARRSGAADELDAMQAEADDILRATLAGYEAGAIDGAALTAFSIALEQFHNAVADRKALLSDSPALLQPRQPRPQAV